MQYFADMLVCALYKLGLCQISALANLEAGFFRKSGKVQLLLIF